MQLRLLPVTMMSALLFLEGCRVSTQLPVKAQDVRICEDVDALIAIVRGISANQRLSFHYGTHPTDYGRQATFRLIGRNYEIELFNSMSESDYTLRVYKAQSEAATDREAEEAFNRFREMLIEATSDNCE